MNIEQEKNNIEKIIGKVIIENPTIGGGSFNPTQYRKTVYQIHESLEAKDKNAADQFLAQEKVKVRFKVASELFTRELSGPKYKPEHEEMIETYLAHQDDAFSSDHMELSEDVPVLDYGQVLQSPVYEYEKGLGLTNEKKIEMLKKVDTYLRERGIYTIFTDKIVDDEADVHKPWEIKDDRNYRDLPIAELVGNKILINPKDVDFMSTFLSIGHIYGHLVQRTEPEEYVGITRFLEYPKPLDLKVIQSEYDKDFGGNYKKDFKVYEEEAFAYAKYTFEDAGVPFTPELEYAMRTYIEADFEELWKWSTSETQKEASDFMQTFTRIHEEGKGKCTPLVPKKVTVEVVPDKEGRIKVVRDGKV